MNEARYREAERRLWNSVGVTPVDRRICLEHSDLTLRIQEVGDGPAVVFIHGATNSGSSWAPLIPHLPGLRCFLLDRPGNGLSAPLPAALSDLDDFARFADGFLAGVLDALRVERAHVISTSMAGYFALRAAAAHPARVGRMVHFGWSMGAATPPIPLVMRLAAVPGLGRLLAAIPPSERMVRSMLSSIGLRDALVAGRVSHEVVDWFLAMLRDTDTMRNEVHSGPRLISPLRGMDPAVELPDELLASIRTPITFLWGDQDPFGGPDAARAFVRRVPNARLEMLPQMGHAVWLDDPAGAGRRTVQALREVDAPDLGTSAH